MAVMRQSVQQRRRHLDISKHLRPFCKAQIGRDHNAGALVEFGQQVKQQRAARLAKRQVPGLTGWAQVNGRDELPIPEKVKLDVAYLQRQSLWFDVRILWLTFVKVLRRDGVSH